MSTGGIDTLMGGPQKLSLSSASVSADSLLRRKRRTCPARSELAVEQFGAAHGNTAAVLSDGLITGIFEYSPGVSDRIAFTEIIPHSPDEA